MTKATGQARNDDTRYEGEMRMGEHVSCTTLLRKASIKTSKATIKAKSRGQGHSARHRHKAAGIMTKKPGGECQQAFRTMEGREVVNVTAATAANPQIRYSANEGTRRNSPLFRRTAADAAFRLLFVVIVRDIVVIVRGHCVSCLVSWHRRVIIERCVVVLRCRAAEGVVVVVLLAERIVGMWASGRQRLLVRWSSGVDLHRFCFYVCVKMHNQKVFWGLKKGNPLNIRQIERACRNDF